ncbi:ExbD/TolR family protein [Thiomicrorhabdus heinhorstiae]|uniref:Biopolymer transporter ExbD n=1 Tax=Thiomicrorhabdus heinhorstiae TaxID=2748010 RepID=A0ABS0BY81_9GAMM|nr:biopolymer transporter ExbD [Thiomicrorhabdus heinhorstiae]MBF6058058.1 biopolymer transporter ExbD [Thiomicrorhabdus heinhorstiae]
MQPKYSLTRNVQRTKRDLEENLIPLINIVFLLLIFFITAGQISQISNNDIDPPYLQQADQLTSKPIYIEVQKDDRLLINGKWISSVELKNHLELFSESEKRQLILKVDKATKAQKLYGLLSSLKNGGVGKILLVTQTQEKADE